MIPEETRFLSLANKYKIPRWTVAVDDGWWHAFDPSATGPDSAGWDGQFTTFQEAINYAQEKARA